MCRDPRFAQIISLVVLACVGSSFFSLPIGAVHVVLCCLTTVTTQYICTWWLRLPSFDPRSPLISGLSLALLLRSSSVSIVIAAGVLAITSKFSIRLQGRHIFNPTNFGIAVVLLCTPNAWLSHGLWGRELLILFLIACLGIFVLSKTIRSDTSLVFLGSWAALHFIRALYLGDPIAIPVHHLQNGTLLIFTFFMISDPKTTPDSKPGRIAFAMLCALIAYYLKFCWYEPNALIYALIITCVTTPVFNRLWSGTHFSWDLSHVKSERPCFLSTYSCGGFMKQLGLVVSFSILGVLLIVSTANAFCGFYVAKADTKLFNKASKVVIVRDDDRTVLTMANDYQGDPQEFAVVIPVPTFIEREQIHVASNSLIEHLDAYSAPRLVEYHDPDPCELRLEMMKSSRAPRLQAAEAGAMNDARSLGVTVEAEYTVGEYDIQILSAKESDGLESWLTQNGYIIPDGAGDVLGSYIKQGLRFFVAKVNLEEQSKLGFTFLRPLQVAYESHKFVLPIRLGTVNANGDQELFAFILTRDGRVETTNYRTVRLPEGMDLPVFIKDDFAEFYRALFAEQVEKENGRAVFLEYAWDMGWCDPCAADPLSHAELKELGVFWLDDQPEKPVPLPGRGIVAPPVAPDVFITRLHVRYNGERFPDDLIFQQTGDKTNFQARYVLRHPWTGSSSCEAAEEYREQLPERIRTEAQQLAGLTGWSMDTVQSKIEGSGYRYPENGRNGAVKREPGAAKKWWEKIW